MEEEAGACASAFLYSWEMEPLPDGVDFIGGFLRRPGMYLIGDKFDGVVNLMFGRRLSSEQARYHDPDVARWADFEHWLYAKYDAQLNGPIFPEFRRWYESDTEALKALIDAYDEFLQTNTTPEILVVNHFEAVLLRPAMYAKNWDEFCGMVRGISNFAGHETHRRDVAIDWEDFQRWLVRKRPDLNSDDGPGDLLDAVRSQCSTDAEAFALIGQHYREFKGF